jgi:hypothetical protein
MCGVMKMSLRCVGVMCRQFMVIRLMIFRGLPMMAGSVVMMFSGFVMVFSSLLRHLALLDLKLRESQAGGRILALSY